MNSMNLVRGAISVLLIALVVIAAGGWVWAGGRPTQEGARLALSLSGGACLLCLGVLWRAKSARSNAR